jgi:hypothetical protein
MKLFRMLVLLAAAAVAFPTFAADELMKAAQAQFNLIPTTPPTLPGARSTTIDVRRCVYLMDSGSHALVARIDSLFPVLGTIRSQS